jgi:serine/threonine-protein kinase HipA
MAVSGKNRHYLMKDVQRRHFNAMAVQCFYGPTAEAIIEDILDRTLDVIEEVTTRLPPAFPARVADGILEGLADSARRLDAMPAS